MDLTLYKHHITNSNSAEFILLILYILCKNSSYVILMSTIKPLDWPPIFFLILLPFVLETNKYVRHLGKKKKTDIQKVTKNCQNLGEKDDLDPKMSMCPRFNPFWQSQGNTKESRERSVFLDQKVISLSRTN